MSISFSKWALLNFEAFVETILGEDIFLLPFLFGKTKLLFALISLYFFHCISTVEKANNNNNNIKRYQV